MKLLGPVSPTGKYKEYCRKLSNYFIPVHEMKAQVPPEWPHFSFKFFVTIISYIRVVNACISGIYDKRNLKWLMPATFIVSKKL